LIPPPTMQIKKTSYTVIDEMQATSESLLNRKNSIVRRDRIAYKETSPLLGDGTVNTLLRHQTS
jgi:hypothetical protein